MHGFNIAFYTKNENVQSWWVLVIGRTLSPGIKWNGHTGMNTVQSRSNHIDNINRGKYEMQPRMTILYYISILGRGKSFYLPFPAMLHKKITQPSTKKDTQPAS